VVRKILALVTLACTVSASGSAQTETPSRATAWVDSSRFVIGDPIHVRLSVRTPAGVAVRPLIGDSLGGFTVLERPTLRRTNDTLTDGVLVVAKYDSGDAVIPPLPFSVSRAGVPDSTIISSNPVPLTVSTVAVDTTKDIRDLKPVVDIPLSWQEILLYAGIALAVVGLAVLGWWYWKKRKAREGQAPEQKLVRPAHVIAFEQLAQLKDKKLWQQGLVKEFYSEVTEIFRRYLENRYSMMAMEETTDQIMGGLRHLRFPDGMLGTAEKVLRRADLVKFAKYLPVPAENDEMITVVHDLVDKTKIVAMSPANEGERTRDHAGD
jgi:hypothetical protein